jgi:putative SOS response-associated peptidase YedK
MCGRYSLFAPRADLERRFDAAFPESFAGSYNCAPGESLPVVTGDGDARRMEWGLVPSWADDDGGPRPINARGESVAETPAFRDAYERRRCLVPADGFYEWVERDGGKRPHRVALDGDEPFAMAGLWERWRPPSTQTGLGEFGGGAPDRTVEPVETFAVVTTRPNDLVADLHDRMAVVLRPDDEATWLHGAPEAAADLVEPYPADGMYAHPVSARVNDPTNDGPDLVEPLSG